VLIEVDMVRRPLTACLGTVLQDRIAGAPLALALIVKSLLPTNTWDSYPTEAPCVGP
jgi:hypothetical protein